MKHLKLFEKFENDSFFKGLMYYLELDVGGHEGFTLEQVIVLTKKLVEHFNENEIEFRIYDYLQQEENCIFFLFNEEPSTGLAYGISIDEIPKKNIPKNVEKFRIPDNDVEIYFDAQKYNL